MITYHLKDYRPRLLRRAAGYTTSPHLALSEEPEAVDEATQEQLAQEARKAWAEYEAVARPNKVAERNSKKQLNRLRKLTAEASRQGIDVSPVIEDFASEMQQQIASQKRKVSE